MKTIFRQTPLYKFLYFCNNNQLENNILDCGAGGDCPPLTLFYSQDYDVQGIELSQSQIDKAETFSKKHEINLNIAKGNMLNIPFENEYFSYVYSYNTIFHMSKNDIHKAVNEIKRVLKPGGLCFINFLSCNDDEYGEGTQIAESEFQQEEKGEKVLHSYFQDDEADKYFVEMKILIKENRILEIFDGSKRVKQGFIDYIVEKKVGK